MNIKMRAWDKEKKVMLYGGGFFPPIRDEGWFFGMIVPYRDCEIMLGTGLTDNNDKEIFDGDIIEMFTEAKKEPAYKKIVEMPYVYSLVGLSDCEIIGNMYEDEELFNEFITVKNVEEPSFLNAHSPNGWDERITNN